MLGGRSNVYVYYIYIVWLVLECFLGVLLARICGRSSEIRLRSRGKNRHFSQHPFFLAQFHSKFHHSEFLNRVFLNSQKSHLRNPFFLTTSVSPVPESFWYCKRLPETSNSSKIRVSVGVMRHWLRVRMMRKLHGFWIALGSNTPIVTRCSRTL